MCPAAFHDGPQWSVSTVDHFGPFTSRTYLVHHVRMNEPDDVQLKIRLPKPLRDYLEQAAKVAGRTLTAEVVRRLEASAPNASFRFLLERRQEELALAIQQLSALNQVFDERRAQMPEHELEARPGKLPDVLDAIDQEMLSVIDVIQRLEDDCEALEKIIDGRTTDTSAKRLSAEVIKMRRA
jgi:hypothetical protein